jgi:hypothetical protein
MDRQQAKLEYKNRKPNMGIYQITNRANGKIYVCSSRNLDGILSRFQMVLKYSWNWDAANHELNRDLKELEPDNFTLEILDRLKPNEDPNYNYSEDLKTLEELWLERLQPFGERGYNRRKAQKGEPG